jgi:hypothetical protein
MANLLGQNIGTNYKGILNLNTLNGNLSGTLQAVTDGDGNASTLLLSTTLARVSSNLTIGGSTTASARLHVRGDGTNPITRFESSAGAEAFIFRDTTQLQFGSQGNYISSTANGTSSSAAGRGLLFVGQSGQNIHQFTFSSINQETSGTLGAINISASYIAGASSALYQPLRIAYTINNSGAQTGTATGIFLNATETALNGMTHNLMDLQVGGVSRFRVDRLGSMLMGSDILFGNGSRLLSGSNGSFRLSNFDNNNFGLLQLGGITNAFPAIKRNGAAIDFRLADDSGYCNVNMGQATFGGGNGYIGINNSSSIDSALRNVRTNSGSSPLSISTGEVGVGDVTTYASAIFAIGSTTRGFLPPRMTTTQVNAITSPAAGLVVYSTTENALCLYNGSSWRKLNDSPL